MDSNMDFTMQHSNHHPHYHHPSGASSAGSAARCPALRAAAEQRNYQLPTISPARGAAQYDSVHSHPGNRNVWQSRSPQAWRPAMVSPPFAQDSMMMGTFSGPATASNQSSPSEQPCPLSNIPHMQNAPEPYAPPMPSFQQFRTTMHPVPRLLTQPAYSSPGGYASSSPSSQSNSQHFSNRPVHRAEAGLPASASVNSMPIAQTPVSGPSANSGHMSQTTPFNNENNNPGPGPQLPNIPHIFAHQNHPTSFSQQTPQPTAQSSSAEQNASRLAPNSFSPPASTASQQTNDQPTRMISPVEIRRASTAAMNRARRSMPRFTTTPSEWIGENAILFRRGEMSLMEFVENYPGTISDGEGPMNAHRFWRGNGSGKRVASKQALSSLQSVNMADLPESERTCVICYNDFGVANPEGINEAPLRLPKCRHVFGDHCIKKWFQESDSCPYCRDQVHSEIQPMQPRRGHPNFRFITPYHISAQHLPGFQQGHDQRQPHDRDTSETESSTQPEHSMSDNMTDSSSILSDTGSGNRPPSGRRFDNNLHHGMRIPSWNATHERRSPPVEYDRRRRPRHRARFSPSSTRSSIFGGPGPNGVSQTSVRPSRSSRSRSPFDPTSTGVRISSRRSLTNNAEQYRWNNSPSPNPSYRGGPSTSGPSGAPMFDSSGFPFQSQTSMPPADFFREFLSANSDVPPAAEQSSGLQQTRSGDSRFSSPTNGVPDAYAATSSQASSNQFTSYQQS